MRPRHALALLVLAVLAPSPARGADRIVLLPASGANVHEGHLAAATDVLRAHLERTGRFAVSVAPVAPGAPGREPDAAEAAEAARAAGAALAVTLRVSRLGATASVRLAAHRPDGTLAHVDEITASGPDDLDPALRRLARGLAEGKPARVLAEIDTVTEREADPYLRFVATNVFGLRLGSAVLLNRVSPPGSSGAAAGGGLFWLHDARSWLADVSLDLFGDSEASLVALGLGAYYPLRRGNVAPYVGGGLAYAWVDTGGEDGRGLQARATVGLLFGRLSTVQLRAEGSWGVSVFEERPAGGGAGHVTHGPILTLGLGY